MAKKSAAVKAKSSSSVVFLGVLAVVFLLLAIVMGLKSHSNSVKLAAATKTNDELSAVLGKRYAVQIRNVSDRPLAVTATVSNLNTGESHPAMLEVPAQNAREIGAGDRWYVSSLEINTGKKVKTPAAPKK